MESFIPGVHDALKSYVYRLVDPRDSSCFYVGKGTGNRCFDHIKNPNGESEKARQIREIQEQGLSVNIYIARHGIDDQLSKQIEAVLIDIFNNIEHSFLKVRSKLLTNKQGGEDSSEQGLASVEEVQEHYAPPAEIQDSVIAVKIDRAISEGKDVYEAARKAWKLSLSRANKTSYLLAVRRGVIKGIYKGVWKPSEEAPGRLEFEGHLAPQDILDRYLDKRLPDSPGREKRKGEQNPVRYLSPSK